jgi:nitric oxide reductase subunit B
MPFSEQLEANSSSSECSTKAHSSFGDLHLGSPEYRKETSEMRRLWIAFWGVIVVSFSVLGWTGLQIYQQQPPIPRSVVVAGGQVMVGPGEVTEGQNIWQAMGGMQLGSVWGHGSYVAPDWTADWLHRECEFILQEWAAQDSQTSFEKLHAERQSVLQTRLQRFMRTNTYDSTTGTITVDPIRARAFEANLSHYAQVFSHGNTEYAIPQGALTDKDKLGKLAGFFFWTSWAASTERPNSRITYISNWPHEPLVGNRPTPDAIVWTGVSIILLLAGIGAMVWFHAARQSGPEPPVVPEHDPLFTHESTPSQKAVLKYFWVVSALILVQIVLGVITAHYGVEGGGFYGIPIGQWLPYVITRTWHTQLGIFWIATAWLAAGLYIAPAVSRVEMTGQRLGVNLLFGALLLIVVGSLAGEWLSVHHKLGSDAWFYFGHQGYEYVTWVESGRLACWLDWASGSI